MSILFRLGLFRWSSRLLVTVAALAASLAVLQMPPAHADPSADLLSMVNQARASQGLAGLLLQPDLAAIAQSHSGTMASEGILRHNPNLATATTNWSSLGENVGYGGSVRQVFDAFMASPGHRANILGNYQDIGLGVVAAGGLVWITQVFRTPIVPTQPPVVCSGVPGRGALEVRRGNVWYFRSTLTSGVADGCFRFGNPSDIPVTGDWNGDGVVTPGVFRPETGTWYLSNDPAARTVDVVIQFASPGDLPVTGDWNNDGRTGIGVFRPSTGTWYLRNTLSSGQAEGAFRFGSPGDQPVAGDWNHDGTTTVGVFRPSQGVWYLSNNLAGVPDAAFRYGSPGDLAVTGDWNGDGTDTLGVFRGGRLLTTDRFDTGSADRVVAFGSPGDVVLKR